MGVDYFVSFWVKVEDYKAEKEIPIHIQEITNNSRSNASSDVVEAVSASPFPWGAISWERDLFLYIYGTLVISLFALALLRSMLFYKLAMICSQKLHDTIFYSVVNATMRFFDTNPGGRILNRFSKDIGSIDELLPKAILDSSQVIIFCFCPLIM